MATILSETRVKNKGVASVHIRCSPDGPTTNIVFVTIHQYRISVDLYISRCFVH